MENNNLNNRKAPWLGRNIFGFLLGMLIIFSAATAMLMVF